MTDNENNDTILPPGEAALVTMDGMQGLGLLIPTGIPDDQNVPPALRFLTACMMRAQEDDAWVHEMVAWVDKRLEDEDDGEVAGHG